MIFDNLNVVRRARATLRAGASLPALSPGLWAKAGILARTLHDVAFEWCPSHGKHPNWKADPPGMTDLWRKLNELADAECTSAIRRHSGSLRCFEEAYLAAEAWSLQALRARATAGALLYRSHDADDCA